MSASSRPSWPWGWWDWSDPSGRATAEVVGEFWARVVYCGEVDGVFGGSPGDGVFVEGGGGGGFEKIWVEDDVGSAAGGPADGFGIAPAFVADGDAEGEGSGLEDLAGDAGGVDAFFGGVDLHFVLVAGLGAVGVDDQGGGAEPLLRRCVRFLG